MAAISHKSWRSDYLFPSFNTPFFPFLSWTLQGVRGELTHPLPNILMQLIQSNNLIKSTLVCNVLQKSACMLSSATDGRTDAMDYRPCIAAWHIWTHTLAESEGVRTPTG